MGFASGNEFLWSDGAKHTITFAFVDGKIDLSQNQTYQIYLWTRSSTYGIYTDANLGVLKTEDGALKDGNGNTLIDKEDVLVCEHVPESGWTTDGESHWKVCTRPDCGVVLEETKKPHGSTGENLPACEKQAVCDVCDVSYGEVPQHIYGDKKPEIPAEIGEEGLKAHYQCSACEGYFVDEEHETFVEKKKVTYEELILPALIDGDLTMEIPFLVTVEKTGEADPVKETFLYEVLDLGFADASYSIEGLSVETDGENTYSGKLIIHLKESQLGNFSEGFKFAQVKGSSEGWTYDETSYYIVPQISDAEITTFVIYPGEDAFGNTILEEIVFVNRYEAEEPVESPATGDNGGMWFWSMLLLVSTFGLITAMIHREKFVQ